MVERKKIARVFTALLCLPVVFGLMAFDSPAQAGGIRLLFSPPSGEEIPTQNIDSFLNNIEEHFSTAMKKNLEGKNLVMAIFLGDYSSGRLVSEDDPWLAQEIESKGKLMAREAIFEGLARTINGVPALHRVQEIGRSMSTAEVTVKEGKVGFSGPSLNPDGNSTDREAQTDESFRSRFKLEGGVDLGMSWRSTFGPFEYRMTYFLVGGDVFGMTLEDRLTDRTRLGVTYRSDIRDQRAVASLSFSLP